jgi:hypothetical protein
MVSQAASHRNDSAFFKAEIPACPACATFHGDYLGLDYVGDGVANLAWTDMRDQSPDFDASSSPSTSPADRDDKRHKHNRRAGHRQLGGVQRYERSHHLAAAPTDGVT